MTKNLINGMKAEFGNIEQIKTLQKEERRIQDEKDCKVMRLNISPLERAIDDEINLNWTYFFISNLTDMVKKKLSDRSPIDIMIDQATGYEKGIIKYFLTELYKAYQRLIKDLKRTGRSDEVENYTLLIKGIKYELKKDYKDIEAIEF